MESSSDHSVGSIINNIVYVVLRTHFYYVTDKDMREDLLQEGYLKAYELLASGNFDPYRNLRTFIYTGVRNAMSNYMYHQNKENHNPLDMVEDGAWQDYKKVTTDEYWKGKVYTYDKDQNVNYEVDYDLIDEVCKKYRLFGNVDSKVNTKLSKLGISEIQNTGEESQDSIDDFIIDAICTEILWKTFRMKQ